MKKKILIIGFITLSIISSLKAENENYSGDKGIACEAFMCLASGGTNLSECSRSLKKFFSIGVGKALKPWELANARKEFLNLCPAVSDSNMDTNMLNQVDSFSQITGECSVKELNANIEKMQVGSLYNGSIIYKYRISPKMTKNCQILLNSNYNEYLKFKYTCPVNKFYTEEDWKNGYEKQEISQSEYNSLKESQRLTKQGLTQINREEYFSLPNDKRFYQNGDGYTYYYSISTIYYKKNPIKKDCWVNVSK